jgi:hypothetical protein
MGYRMGMAGALRGRPRSGINQANGVTACSDLVRNGCARDARPNHHDAMVLGCGHAMNGN